MGKIYKQITSIALIREHRFVLGTYDTTGHHHLILQVTRQFFKQDVGFFYQMNKATLAPTQKIFSSKPSDFSK